MPIFYYQHINKLSTVLVINMTLLEHNRNECIGCAACVAIYPEGWEMAEDGKSDVIKGTKRKDGWEEKKLTEEEAKLHKEAAECCPVVCIHVKK